MKVRTAGVLGAVGLGAAVLLSRNRGRECNVSMHPDDWRGLKDGDTHRRFRSLEQTLHHTKELVGLLGPTGELYLRQAIPPAFREQIMVVTATCNDCDG
jgi:hypothetical protein